jgi:hypothetical protein
MAASSSRATARAASAATSWTSAFGPPVRPTAAAFEEFDDRSGEHLASYAFRAVGDTARVELEWLCGERIPFFENFAGWLSFVVDFQVAFTRDAAGGDPIITRDYRTRGWVDL